MSQRIRRQRRGWQRTRSCVDNFLSGEADVPGDLIWKLFASLKDSVTELSESLHFDRKVLEAPEKQEDAQEDLKITTRPYASVPRRLEPYLPWESLRPLLQELDAQAYLASSQHVLYPSLFNFISGLDTGVTSFAVLQLTDAHLVGSHMLPFSSWDVGAVVSARVCGALCGSMLLLCTSKEPSSRDLLAWTGVGITAISLCTFLAADRNTLLLLRFLAGLAEGVSSPAKAAYVVETVEADLRGASNGTRWAAFALGSCAGVAMGAVLRPIPGAWQVMLAASAVPAALAGAGMLALPHSPRWLAHTAGEGTARERAMASLETLRPHHDRLVLQQEMDIICQGLTNKSAKEVKVADVWDTLQHPATEISALVTFFKQANGTIAMTAYLAPVLAAMGCERNFTVLGIVLTAVRSVTTPLGIVLMDRIGRRGSLLLGCLGTSASMSVLFASHALGSHASAGLMTASFGSFVAATALFELCWAPTTYQLTTELYPQEIRQHGLALSHVFNYGVKAIEMQLFPLFLGIAGLTPFFAVCAVVNTAGALVVYHIVPETCGRTLEEVKQLWEEPDHEGAEAEEATLACESSE
ncbi:unnamed protein product [Effrenium voratum]|uniref:Major facilitator superfamily (MFS) profile domain-containing protein n=1 Tax=Effrenium voratum TaxID=2562239 RepID=A0AA36JNE5_9DINO|nr:unnamed protein product [Effrenium voratum]CAJ1424622.1 unnamed protein product [Effrenium voratum]